MRDHLGPWDLHLNKLGKRPLGNAIYQCYESKTNGFGEEDFLIFFMYFYGLSLGPPGGGGIFKPGIFI